MTVFGAVKPVTAAVAVAAVLVRRAVTRCALTLRVFRSKVYVVSFGIVSDMDRQNRNNTINNENLYSPW